MKSITLLLCAAALVTASGCASSPSGVSGTVFEESWADPDAQPLQLRGSKVVAAVIIQDPPARRRAEDALARQITALGGQGVPMYSISLESAPDKEGESKTRAAVEAIGAKGIVVMRPIDVQHKTSATDAMSADDVYGGYWGGYYGIGWSDPWIEKSPDVRTDLVVTVETLVFSLPQNKLIWTGTSATTNPENVERLVNKLAVEGTTELRSRGLLAP
jgi:hypothetical protein